MAKNLFSKVYFPLMQRTQNKKISYKRMAFFLIGIAAVALGIIFLPFCKSYKIQTFNRAILPYDDRTDKSSPGNSEILWVKKDSTELKISYILRDGFDYPYAGIIVPLGNGNNNFADFTRFDALKIRISSSQLSDCKIYLLVFDKNTASLTNVPISERYIQKNLLLNPYPKTFLIPFNQFKTPEWWFQKNNITLKDVSPADFSNVISLKIESGPTARTGTVDTMTVTDIYMVKRPRTNVLAPVLFLLMLCITYIFYRSAPRKKNEPVVITYDKKEVRSYRDIDAQRISDYLAKNFSVPDISIISTGKALGFSQKKLALTMNNEFKMSFKQYLTSIRIFEAKRLLLETDRLVTDIALEVGFNNISHFNRVFKASTQTSPLEFRNRKTAS